MSVKKGRKLRNILFIAGAAIMLIFGTISEVMMIIGVIVTVSCLIPHFLFNRCPCCGKQLGRSEGDFCQFCGARLDE